VGGSGGGGGWSESPKRRAMQEPFDLDERSEQILEASQNSRVSDENALREVAKSQTIGARKGN